MNKCEFEAAMKRFGDTQDTLAEAIGISRTRLNAKINERDDASFTQPEIFSIKERYSLTPDEVDSIFFAKSVS